MDVLFHHPDHVQFVETADTGRGIAPGRQSGPRDVSVNMTRRSKSVRSRRENIVKPRVTPREKRPRAHIDVTCMGEKRTLLLDSGCDTTILPANYVIGALIHPTRKNAIAANGTPIELLGTTHIDLVIDDLVVPTTALVSEFVDEGLIGLDWLVQNNVTWGFGLGYIGLQGQMIELTIREDEDVPCNRIVVQSSVTVPARSETIVPGKIVFSTDCISIEDYEY